MELIRNPQIRFINLIIYIFFRNLLLKLFLIKYYFLLHLSKKKKTVKIEAK